MSIDLVCSTMFGIVQLLIGTRRPTSLEVSMITRSDTGCGGESSYMWTVLTRLRPHTEPSRCGFALTSRRKGVIEQAAGRRRITKVVLLWYSEEPKEVRGHPSTFYINCQAPCINVDYFLNVWWNHVLSHDSSSRNCGVQLGDMHKGPCMDNERPYQALMGSALVLPPAMKCKGHGCGR